LCHAPGTRQPVMLVGVCNARNGPSHCNRLWKAPKPRTARAHQALETSSDNIRRECQLRLQKIPSTSRIGRALAIPAGILKAAAKTWGRAQDGELDTWRQARSILIFPRPPISHDMDRRSGAAQKLRRRRDCERKLVEVWAGWQLAFVYSERPGQHRRNWVMSNGHSDRAATHERRLGLSIWYRVLVPMVPPK